MTRPSPAVIAVLELAEAGKPLMTDVGEGLRGLEAKAGYYERREAVQSAHRADWIDGAGRLTERGRFALAGVR